MRSNRFRRSGHPLTRAIDAAIDARRLTNQPVTTGLIASDLVSTVPAALMLSEFGRLVGSKVRIRLKARGELPIDSQTWMRKIDQDINDLEWSGYVGIKRANFDAVRRHLRADEAIGKLLTKEATKLGRRVTLAELEGQINKVYAHHGLPPL